MSKSLKSFNFTISDAKELLECYDILNNSEEHTGSDALKRSTLIMTLTAWEIYVEDIVTELFGLKFGALKGCQIGDFMERQLELRLKAFHNPNSAKTKQIFEEFFGFDVTEDWVWNNYQPKPVREILNKWISKRGDSVHRSVVDKTKPHIVKRDELQKCITFFIELVQATDDALASLRLLRSHFLQRTAKNCAS